MKQIFNVNQSFYLLLVVFHSLRILSTKSEFEAMGVELSLDPPVCPIQASGGKSKHKMINHTDRPIAFKIKSTNNSNYSVNQIFGIIKVCEVFNLEITRKSGKPQADKLVIQYAAVGEDCTDPKSPFASGNPVSQVFTGETIIKLSAAE